MRFQGAMSAGFAQSQPVPKGNIITGTAISILSMDGCEKFQLVDLIHMAQ